MWSRKALCNPSSTKAPVAHRTAVMDSHISNGRHEYGNMKWNADIRHLLEENCLQTDGQAEGLTEPIEAGSHRPSPFMCECKGKSKCSRPASCAALRVRRSWPAKATAARGFVRKASALRQRILPLGRFPFLFANFAASHVSAWIRRVRLTRLTSPGGRYRRP